MLINLLGLLVLLAMAAACGFIVVGVLALITDGAKALAKKLRSKR